MTSLTSFQLKRRSLFCGRICAAALGLLFLWPLTARAIDPTGRANTNDVTSAGATSYSFQVEYQDDGAVDVSTINNADVRVSGPNGFDSGVTLVDGQPSNAVAT